MLAACFDADFKKCTVFDRIIFYIMHMGPGGTVTLKLGPRQQIIVPDALEYLRSKGISIGPKGAAHYAGALRVSVEGACLADVGHDATGTFAQRGQTYGRHGDPGRVQLCRRPEVCR